MIADVEFYIQLFYTEHELGQSVEIELVKLSNENDLEEFTLNRSVSLKQPPIGIVFLELVSDSAVPNKLIYKLRHSVAINTNGLLPKFSIVGENEYGKFPLVLL